MPIKKLKSVKSESSKLDAKLSDEQNHVLELAENHNVIINAVAGSGKSTTNLAISKKFKSLKILLLTYNARLKLETREKIKNQKIINLECHSYHSFCVKYYDNLSFNDSKIKSILEKNLEPLMKFEYDMILLDEAQDITQTYYELVCKIIKDNGKIPKIILTGDRYQNIYSFSGSDFRFLTKANEVFNFNGSSWEEAELTQTYRSTKQMCDFLNHCVLKENRVRSSKEGSKPKYIVTNCFKYSEECKIYQLLINYVKQGYTYDDFFILAPSIRSAMSPVRQFANLLTEKNIPLFCPTSDTESLDNDVIRGKLVLSSFHQVKGLERKIVIVYNFENSYFKFCDRNGNQSVCPNPIYVALTRALEHLVVLHHYKNDFLPFLEVSKLDKYCDVIYEEELGEQNNNDCQTRSILVTDLTRNLNQNIIYECMKLIEVIQIRKAGKPIKIKQKVIQGEKCEMVCDINEVAIPGFFEYTLSGKISFMKQIPQNLSAEELLKISNEWCATKSGYDFKKNQIKNYDWITKDDLSKTNERLSEIITKDAKFEVTYETTLELIEEFGFNVSLEGIIDCIDKNNIFEFKCTTALDENHILQLVCYAFLFLNEVIDQKENKIGIIEREILKLKSETLSVGDSVTYLCKKVEKIGKVIGLRKGDKVAIRNQDGTQSVVSSKNIIIDVNQRSNKIKLKEEEKEMISGGIEQYSFQLFNIITGEILQLKFDMESLNNVIELLIMSKFKGNLTSLSDSSFLEQISKIKMKYEI